MINKTKFGDCSQCSATDTNVVKIRTELICCNCNKRNKAKQYMAKARERNLVRSLVSSPANTSNAEHDKVYKAELDLWFLTKMKNSRRKCENCGKDLSNLNDIDWKGSQHHILEKSIFKSVRTHPDNHLVLGRWCCHPQWHTNMLNASKMPIFQEANRKVIILAPLLPRDEFRKLSEYYCIG